MTSSDRNSNALARISSPADRDSAIIHVPKDGGNINAVLHPSKAEEFLPPIGFWTVVGGLAGLAVFGTGIWLSTILKYKTSVQASAVIRPVGELKVVQSAVEGSIVSIQVKENQSVKAGDPIATINDSKLETKQSQLEGEIQKSKQQMSAVEAQVNALTRQMEAEAKQVERTIAGDLSQIERYEREFRDKNIMSKAEVDEAEANVRTAEKELQANEAEMQSAIANLRSAQATYQAAVIKAKRFEIAASSGVISKSQFEEAQLAAKQQEQAVIAQQSTIARQEKTIARYEQSVAAARAKVARAQAGLNPSRAEIDTVRQKIAREQAIGQSTIARLNREREQLLQQRVDAYNQILTTQKELKQIAADRQFSTVRAPVSGIIQDLNLRNNFQVVRPGDRLAQIVPDNTPLDIKAIVPGSDIDKIKVGQVVNMRVSSCPYTEYGVLNGKVTEVASDASNNGNSMEGRALTKESGANNPPTYSVTIKPETLQLGVEGKTKCQIRSGMEGRTDIISKEETAFQFMMKKARLIFD
jgi:multidrug efflux pump subunit AcrA (membrane-fusion protein)